MNRQSRRAFSRYSVAGVLGVSHSGWLRALADSVVDPHQHPPRRSCILLWMHGGPSQIDTFDLKSGHENGGPFREIQTNVPGIHIGEHLPRIAEQMHRLTLVRSMSTKEGDHARATFHIKTGYPPQGPVAYPPIGALAARHLSDADCALPGFVSISPARGLTPSTLGAGFLGPRYAPLTVGGGLAEASDAYAPDVPGLDAAPGIDGPRAQHRLDLLLSHQRTFLASHRDGPHVAHQAAVEAAIRLMHPDARSAFDLDEESPSLRDAYGRTHFGQGCLLARRLVERGVPFVEVTLGGSNDGTSGWDTHYHNFEAVPRLCRVLDTAWSTLLDDLQSRGLLDDTLVIWAGEFGRTPKINQMQGRDHYPTAWSTALAGGGIHGGGVVGRTSRDGTAVEDRPVSVPDFLATVCLALGIDPGESHVSNVGRPIHIVDKSARPLTEIVR
ncbi:MAG: DUF1501 domain-containing protein [Planctomycetaceae bacterium]